MRRDASGLPFVCQPAWLKPSCRRLIGLAYGGHDVKGLENVPRSGPFIVAATHRSYFDPFLISAFLPRPLYFMAKRELFKNPLFGILLRTLGAFPVDRENARSSTFRTALGLLKKGGAVVIFPEGGIADAFDQNGFKAGVGTLASLSGAPILPVVVSGSGSLLNRRAEPSTRVWLAIRVGATIQSSGTRSRESRKLAARRTAIVLREMTREFENS